MKIVVAIIPTDLVTNSLLSSFCPLLHFKNKNQVFSRLVIWKQEIFLFFVYALYFKAMQNSTDFYKNNFLTCYSCSYYSSMMQHTIYNKYLSSTFETLRKKNEKSSRFRYFPRFRGFALCYKSAELVESWANILLSASKTLDCQSSELKLILHLVYYPKLNKEGYYLRKRTGDTCYTN